MLLERDFDQSPASPPSLEASPSAGEFWLQETMVRGARRAIIHADDCPVSETRQNPSGDDKWHGPFDALTSARESSDRLSGIAIRAECRCVRRGLDTDVPRMALLNEPLFRKPEPVRTEKKAARRDPEKPAAAQTKKAAANAKKRRSKQLQLAISGVSIAMVLVAVLLWLPALSVVEAANRPTGSPFLIANGSHLAVRDLNADCSVELQPAAVKLRGSHEKLADSLTPQEQVSVPCFQAVGGATPQTSGMTMRLTLSYATLGIHHAQTFIFVAARATDGVSHWVEEGQE